MKMALRISVLGFAALVMLAFDVAPPGLVSDAYAIAGVRRRTARRTAVVVGSAGAASTAAAQQQAAAAQQQAAAAEADAAAAEAEAAAAQQQLAAQQAATAQPAPAPQAAPAAAGALPIGTIVTALPAGCPATTINNVEYYACGGNYYRAAFQGSQLVYVTTQP
jgi:hypothetical protein